MEMGMSTNKRADICLYTNHLTSELGLRGIPAPLKHLSKEVGLAGDPWANLGERWQSLAKLWICTVRRSYTRSGTPREKTARYGRIGTWIW